MTKAIARARAEIEHGFTTVLNRVEARLSERMESTVVDINSRIVRVAADISGLKEQTTQVVANIERESGTFAVGLMQLRRR